MDGDSPDTYVADGRILALFVDGDNISHQLIEDIVNESSKFGQLYMKRVYGNWQSSEMQGWKEKIQDNAILPIQVFPNITGKKFC